jgi:hypothetical protein
MIIWTVIIYNKVAFYTTRRPRYDGKTKSIVQNERKKKTNPQTHTSAQYYNTRRIHVQPHGHTCSARISDGRRVMKGQYCVDLL